MYAKNYSWRKLLGNIHLWLGLSSGLVVMILGITGCIYTFIDEIRPVVYHDRLYLPVAPKGERLPLALLKEKAAAALHKKVPLLSIEVFSNRRRTMVFRYRERNDNATLYSRYFISYDRVYLNPYTGELVKVEDSKWEFFNLVVMMHCTLLLGYTGKQVITWSTVIFIILLISGLVMWWPKNKAVAGKRLRFKWKSTTGWKRKNYDLHQILGFYIVLIAFFTALSGLCMVLPAVENVVQFVLSGGKERALKAISTHCQQVDPLQQVMMEKTPLDRMLVQAVTGDPDAAEYRFYMPKDASAPLLLKSYQDGQGHNWSQQYAFDQNSAVMKTRLSFSALSAAEQVHEATYDIHVGAILGLPGKIMVFLTSLIAASLPLSGFLIWRSRRKGAKNKTIRLTGSSTLPVSFNLNKI